MGHAKSAVLLLGRLLMAVLFLFVGYTQVSDLRRLPETLELNNFFGGRGFTACDSMYRIQIHAQVEDGTPNAKRCMLLEIEAKSVMRMDQVFRSTTGCRSYVGV